MTAIYFGVQEAVIISARVSACPYSAAERVEVELEGPNKPKLLPFISLASIPAVGVPQPPLVASGYTSKIFGGVVYIVVVGQ